MEDRCVCCGAVIPEGRQVCPACEEKADLPPFSIGQTVYILGRYSFTSFAPVCIIEAKISHIEHRQYVAYGVNGSDGTWRFSRKHYGKSVFTERQKAVEELKRCNERLGRTDHA